jgi:bifunctional DNA-binding transcriptional regulator/antitoxin component of YhaV-PrlF toxin-antitoxin module
VTAVYQVAVPVALLRALDLEKGSEVYFLMSDKEPDSICIIPAKRVAVTSSGEAS